MKKAGMNDVLFHNFNKFLKGDFFKFYDFKYHNKFDLTSTKNIYKDRTISIKPCYLHIMKREREGNVSMTETSFFNPKSTPCWASTLDLAVSFLTKKCDTSTRDLIFCNRLRSKS